jgi:ADP-ribose pyrophosphatase YjhB (NUDIX family)
VHYLPDDLYMQIEQSIPISCVDFVPIRRGEEGTEVGLILRESPFGQVWCHLGGRVQRGETVGDAIRRHARQTLDVEIDLGPDPQPVWVYQWFPDDLRPQTALVAGRDPRKHAIGLSYVVDLTGEEPRPQDEALDFAYFPIGALPNPLWPGCEDLVCQLASRALLGRNDRPSQRSHRPARTPVRPSGKWRLGLHISSHVDVLRWLDVLKLQLGDIDRRTGRISLRGKAIRQAESIAAGSPRSA